MIKQQRLATIGPPRQRSPILGESCARSAEWCWRASRYHDLPNIGFQLLFQSVRCGLHPSREVIKTPHQILAALRHAGQDINRVMPL
jgi:hypothetical protein